jgi:uncharacterized protein (UPF0147 family)
MELYINNLEFIYFYREKQKRKMELEAVLGKIDETSQDYSMPRRVKAVLKKVGEDLKKKDQDMSMRITTAIYGIEEVSGDINIPMHAKTQLWDIISDLESLKRL